MVIALAVYIEGHCVRGIYWMDRVNVLQIRFL